MGECGEMGEMREWREMCGVGEGGGRWGRGGGGGEGGGFRERVGSAASRLSDFSLRLPLLGGGDVEY
jgi:hypothetical protein